MPAQPTTAARAGTTAHDHDDRGTGAPALLCLPGWCGSRAVFGPLVASSSRSRRTIAMDLRDHGGTPRVADDFGSATVVDDAIELLSKVDVEQVVPVALSHAGWIAIELRRRLGAERVPAVVLVDWMPLGAPDGFLDALAGLQDEQAWRQVRGGLFEMWTSGVSEPAVHEYVADMGGYGFRHWRRAGREIARAFGDEGTPLASLERLDEPCRVLHLYAQPLADRYLAEQVAYSTTHPWFRVRRLAASSHFPMLEVPDEMSTAIEEFLCLP